MARDGHHLPQFPGDLLIVGGDGSALGFLFGRLESLHLRVDLSGRCGDRAFHFLALALKGLEGFQVPGFHLAALGGDGIGQFVQPGSVGLGAADHVGGVDAVPVLGQGLLHARLDFLIVPHHRGQAFAQLRGGNDHLYHNGSPPYPMTGRISGGIVPSCTLRQNSFSASNR